MPINLCYVLALLAGALSALAFAPVGVYPLAPLGLAALFLLLRQTGTARPFVTGWLFGLGFFGVGVSWVYVSLHTYGGMAAPLALLATFLFCALLALFPGLASSFWDHRKAERAQFLLLLPAAWTLLEWVRGWIFTGFPWLATGYSQVPDSPFAGYAPLLGVYGVSFVTALSAGGLAWTWRSRGNLAAASRGMMLVLVLIAGGVALKAINWTQPHGAPLSVALVQGNIPQEMKWDPELAAASLKIYRQLADSTRARLVVLPETALPVFFLDLPEMYKNELRRIGQERGGDVLAGVPTGDSSGAYLNSVASFGAEPTQFYHKHHLVPFGEFIPPGFGWVLRLLHIPLSDFSRGGASQAPFSVAGQKVAVNICYEDAFGEEIIHALPAATLLVNVSNDAWFGDGFAARQHRQISQMRALETGRMVLRATNTGSTAIIDIKGRVVSEMDLFRRGILQGQAQGYQGLTPYARWGNLPVAVAVLVLLFVLGRGQRLVKRKR
ncbi:MAG TPA: apolipoprotein N-acyltransferase [Thiobacillaceae bacterium]|nr:apolipoprotein N-acyltransferase [Thiobacillaceae bacterium]